jgi:hypothetical protein
MKPDGPPAEALVPTPGVPLHVYDASKVRAQLAELPIDGVIDFVFSDAIMDGNSISANLRETHRMTRRYYKKFMSGDYRVRVVRMPDVEDGRARPGQWDDKLRKILPGTTRNFTVALNQFDSLRSACRRVDPEQLVARKRGNVLTVARRFTDGRLPEALPTRQRAAPLGPMGNVPDGRTARSKYEFHNILAGQSRTYAEPDFDVTKVRVAAYAWAEKNKGRVALVTNAGIPRSVTVSRVK